MNPFHFLLRDWWCEPGLDYERILEQRFHREVLFLLMDKDTYSTDKSDLNLCAVYQQEVRVRNDGLALMRYKLMTDPGNEGLLGLMETFESQKSRFAHLAMELGENVF